MSYRLAAIEGGDRNFLGTREKVKKEDGKTGNITMILIKFRAW
jgi:hypothetical protein